ncbi:PQQ-binding-like beta-propeller repeat protein [Thalassomonas viridans]|uniref:PQQ-binding-like beta-propeller repeat protein n=1 Tax=Thalassomonas viridans TaxID=137584 RepID=A0AAF0CB55_9GAMM|nr:PQQ-binding-like beta-propeller repeat protein [Thalassomonas viridans]WDE07603.1 PQQ-binding-like beta-propeller repeat protein [Thalassomonas viridans]
MKIISLLKSILLILAISYFFSPHTGYAKSGDHLWSFTTGGAIWSDIKVRNKTAYFGSDDGFLYAVDIKKRQLKWKKATGGIVRSTPAFKKKKLYFTSDDGYLYALDARTGEELWKLDLGDGDMQRNGPAGHAPWDFDWAKSSPVIKGKYLYVGSATGELFAVNLHQGKIIWTFSAKNRIRATPTVSGNLVYITSWDGHVYGINRKSGQKIWQFAANLKNYDFRFVSAPSVIDDKIIVGNRDSQLYALNSQTGEKIWDYTYEGSSWVESTATAATEHGSFFIASSDALQLYKFDSETGNVQWTAPLPGWSWGKPAVTEDTVYIGSAATDDYWQPINRGFKAIDSSSGALKWSYEPAHLDNGYISGGVHSSPAVKYGQVFVGDLDGKLHVFEE